MTTTYQYTPPLVEEAQKAGLSQIVYPAWPTSKPGPAVTSPPLGQRPHARRSDQMVYECYDQELGMPCEPVARSFIREQRGKIYLPDGRFQEVVYEAEALQRWLDDGGTSKKEVTSDAGDRDVSVRQEEPLAV